VAPNAAIPGALEQVVRRALAKKRDERFKSATEFLSAIEMVGEVTNPGLRPRAPSKPIIAPLLQRIPPLLDRLPPQTRRLLPVFAIAFVAILFVVFFGRGLRRGPASTPPPPKPAAPEVARYTQLAEEALSQGDLAKAKEHLAALEQICLMPCDEYDDLKRAIAEYNKLANR